MGLRGGPASPRAASGRLTAALAFLAAVALLLAGCTAGAAGPTTTTQSKLPNGRTLDTDSTVTVGVLSLPSNFNPATPTGDNRVTQMIMEQVWPQPFVMGPNYTPETSDLLESAEVEGVSPLKVVYVINPKAEWSDGVPITAADFAYCWHEHVAAPGSVPDSGVIAGYRDIASVVGSKGGRTVTVTFRRPFWQWQSLFADLVPAHVGARYGWSSGFEHFSPGHILSGGPFRVSSYSPGHELVLDRNPRYWGPPAHVARIRFIKEPSQKAIERGLRSGALSLAEVGASASLSGPSRVAVSGGTDVMQPEPSDLLYQLIFNLDGSVTSQVDVRRGIEHSLDRSEIVADSEALVDPRAQPATSRFMPAGEMGSFGASPGRRAAEKVPPLYDPTAALGWFQAAGYTPGGQLPVGAASTGTGTTVANGGSSSPLQALADGRLQPVGGGPALRLTLLVPKGNWAVERAGQVIQAELRDMGLSVTIERRPLEQMLTSLLPSGAYEMALAPFAISPTLAAVVQEYADPVFSSRSPSSLAASSANPWSTPTALGTDPGASQVGGVTRDVIGVDAPAVDGYLSSALYELSPAHALGDLARAEAWLWQQAVSVPLFQPGSYLVRSGKLDNVSVSPGFAGFMWDAEDWAIVQPPAKSKSSGGS